MTSIKAKKGTVKSNGGMEGYLREECGLLDEVSLKRTKDGGMHGNLYYIWDTPDGEVKCSAYASSPPVATYKMSVSTEEDAQAMFGVGLSELRDRFSEADTGF